MSNLPDSFEKDLKRMIPDPYKLTLISEILSNIGDMIDHSNPWLAVCMDLKNGKRLRIVTDLDGPDDAVYFDLTDVQVASEARAEFYLSPVSTESCTDDPQILAREIRLACGQELKMTVEDERRSVAYEALMSGIKNAGLQWPFGYENNKPLTWTIDPHDDGVWTTKIVKDGVSYEAKLSFEWGTSNLIEATVSQVGGEA